MTTIKELVSFLKLDIEQTKELLSGDLKTYTDGDLEIIRTTLLHEEITLKTIVELAEIQPTKKLAQQ